MSVHSVFHARIKAKSPCPYSISVLCKSSVFSINRISFNMQEMHKYDNVCLNRNIKAAIKFT